MNLIIHTIKTGKMSKSIDLNTEISNILGQKLRCPPFIYTLENIGSNIFAGTETGHLLRLGLKKNF